MLASICSVRRAPAITDGTDVIRPATLRVWERAGLVQPRRDRRTGYRVYSAADVRDAHLVHHFARRARR